MTGLTRCVPPVTFLTLILAATISVGPTRADRILLEVPVGPGPDAIPGPGAVPARSDVPGWGISRFVVLTGNRLAVLCTFVPEIRVHGPGGALLRSFSTAGGPARTAATPGDGARDPPGEAPADAPGDGDLAVSVSGRLLHVDGAGRRILELDPGSGGRRFHPIPTGVTFEMVTGLLAGPAGALLVADESAGRIHRFATRLDPGDPRPRPDAAGVGVGVGVGVGLEPRGSIPWVPVGWGLDTAGRLVTLEPEDRSSRILLHGSGPDPESPGRIAHAEETPVLLAGVTPAGELLLAAPDPHGGTTRLAWARTDGSLVASRRLRHPGSILLVRPATARTVHVLEVPRGDGLARLHEIDRPSRR